MIIFLSGADTYRSGQKLNQIKEKFLKEVDSAGLNLSVLDGAKLKFEDFNQQAKAAPFLARKRMVIIKNLISENKSKDIQKEVISLLDRQSKNPKDDSIIVFFENTGRPKGKNALWERLAKEKYAEEFAPLNPAQAQAWLKNELKKENVKMEASAISLLSAMIGNDLWQMSNEIAKLKSFASGRVITSADIANLVKAKYEEDIFKFTDALGAGNKKIALKLLAGQIDSGANEIYLLTMITRQFRILLQLKSCPQNIQPALFAKNLKIHPYVAQKALAQARNFTLEKLKDIYGRLLQIDSKIKTGAGKPRILLDLFIAQL